MNINLHLVARQKCKMDFTRIAASPLLEPKYRRHQEHRPRQYENDLRIYPTLFTTFCCEQIEGEFWQFSLKLKD